MVKVPTWFKGLRESAAATANSVKSAVQVKFCGHFWKRTSEWSFAGANGERVVTRRTASCVLCPHTMEVDQWSELPQGMSYSDRDAILAAKAAVQ